MLTNGGVTIQFGVSSFARSVWLRSAWMSQLLSLPLRNMMAYLWIGKPSTNLEKEVKTVVESCYDSVSTCLVFTSKRMLPVACKDVLPAIQKSFVIYEYKCHCDSRYVGRTSQRLQDRIKQHVPQW